MIGNAYRGRHSQARVRGPEPVKEAAGILDTRTSRRMARRKEGRRRRVAILLLTMLFAAGGGAWMLLPHEAAAYESRRFDESKAVTSSQLIESSHAADRSQTRENLADGSWDTGETIDANDLTLLHADNPVVRALINGRDLKATPQGFDPDHDSGDDGSGYPYGQCTWWAYKRRHELGLPVGSRMGDAKDWTDAAQRLGYWTDSTPRRGDIAVFRPDQRGASPVYGHVAIVENVNPDGSVAISESNVKGLGVVTTRTMDADTAHSLEYIHY